MPRAEIRQTVSADKLTLLVETLVEGHLVSGVELDSVAVEDLIAQLGANRSGMDEPVVRTLEEGARIPAILDPIWVGAVETIPDGRPFYFRHPGFGWLGFVFPEEEAFKIAAWLTRALPAGR